LALNTHTSAEYFMKLDLDSLWEISEDIKELMPSEERPTTKQSLS